jgi:hypothetical protein
MANEMPPADSFTGLSRKVLQYSERFKTLTERLREPDFSEADWGPLEELVDTANWDRHGVFFTDQAESFGWKTYKDYITRFAGDTEWEGTLRHITESPGRVILELEERNTRDGFTHRSNTVTIYEFGDDEKLRHLDVYVMSLNQRPG